METRLQGAMRLLDRLRLVVVVACAAWCMGWRPGNHRPILIKWIVMHVCRELAEELGLSEADCRAGLRQCFIFPYEDSTCKVWGCAHEFVYEPARHGPMRLQAEEVEGVSWLPPNEVGAHSARVGMLCTCAATAPRPACSAFREGTAARAGGVNTRAPSRRPHRTSHSSPSPLKHARPASMQVLALLRKDNQEAGSFTPVGRHILQLYSQQAGNKLHGR